MEVLVLYISKIVGNGKVYTLQYINIRSSISKPFGVFKAFWVRVCREDDSETATVIGIDCVLSREVRYCTRLRSGETFLEVFFYYVVRSVI